MDAKAIISKAGLKVTHQRVAVLETMMFRKDHPCVDELYTELSKTIHGLSRATLYNILEQFFQKGVLEKITTMDGKLRYDFKDTLHHHIHDIDNGQIVDYYDEELNKLLTEYFRNKKINDYEIIDVKVEIKGKPIKTKQL